jgi:hypothetical protein
MRVVPKVVYQQLARKMFEALAPHKVTLVAALVVKSPEIWKIHTSSAEPEIVMLEGIVTVDPHLYKPGVSV